MRDLLILGDYPHAVEMAEIVGRINDREPTWNLLGFVSQHEDHVGGMLLNLPVFGFADALGKHPQALIVPEYDWPRKGDLPRERLVTLIDPSACVSSTAIIGAGCVIYPHCFVGAWAEIGDFLFCLSGSVINHSNIIEDRVTLTSGVVLAGDVHVEDGCYLGQSSTVKELLRIGKGSIIGMGSVVLHDVPPNSVMVGNPARRLGTREFNFPGMYLFKSMKRSARMSIRELRIAVGRLPARRLVDTLRRDFTR